MAELRALRARVAELEGAAEELARLKKRGADPLSIEEEYYRTLLEHLPDGVVACNAEGTLVLFNQTSREWHGMDALKLPPEEWSSRYDLFGPDGRTPLAVDQIPLLRAFRGERVRDAEMVIAARGQAPRFIFASGDPLLDASGRTVGAVAVMRDATAQRRAEEARRASEKQAEEALRHTIRQEELIHAQALALAALSTPLIPIHRDVVVMPLVGVLDAHRIQQVMATLLTGISERRSRAAILDVTGVSVVDAHVATGLLRAARAAELLGSKVVLTGIRPDVAQSLIGVGVSLDGIVTRSTLESGIAYAMSADAAER